LNLKEKSMTTFSNCLLLETAVSFIIFVFCAFKLQKTYRFLYYLIALQALERVLCWFVLLTMPFQSTTSRLLAWTLKFELWTSVERESSFRFGILLVKNDLGPLLPRNCIQNLYLIHLSCIFLNFWTFLWCWARAQILPRNSWSHYRLWCHERRNVLSSQTLVFWSWSTLWLGEQDSRW